MLLKSGYINLSLLFQDVKQQFFLTHPTQSLDMGCNCYWLLVVGCWLKSMATDELLKSSDTSWFLITDKLLLDTQFHPFSSFNKQQTTNNKQLIH